MNWIKRRWKVIFIYLFINFVVFSVTKYANRAVSAVSEMQSIRSTVIVDAGHGGVDGGAVSCTGAYESHINLEIALKVDTILHLLGVDTVMIRDTDRSVYTQGSTIAAKKVSDIRQRVKIANETPCALLVSIHQNHYSDAKYWGSQVFYNGQEHSKQLAQLLQDNLRTHTAPNNNRKSKASKGVYLMEHIHCPGVLIECGFLSNPAEEAKLRDPDYQKQLAAVVAATAAQYLNT